MATLTFKEGETFQSDNKTIYQVASGSVNMSYSGGSTRVEKVECSGHWSCFCLSRPLHTRQLQM